MALYFIHLTNGDGFIRDDVGIEVVDLEAARAEAVCSGADIIADELKQGCESVRVTLFIEDASHKQVMTIPMSGDITARR